MLHVVPTGIARQPIPLLDQAADDVHDVAAAMFAGVAAVPCFQAGPGRGELLTGHSPSIRQR
jgi:hypothetical protein